MADSALARTARALDLIPYIVENPGVTISELAKTFESSEKQIAADLNLLFLCGLPGYTPLELIDLSLEDEIVTIIDPQVLDRPRTFTKAELLSLILALRLLEEFPATTERLREEISELGTRLKKIAGSSVSNGGSHVDVISLAPDEAIAARVTTVTEALRKGAALAFEYHSIARDLISQRRVLPQSLENRADNIYLLAYDLDAKENRTFRMDRIERITLEIAPGNDQSNSVNGDRLTTTVRLTLQSGAEQFIEENLGAITNDHLLAATGGGAQQREIVMEIFDPQWLINEVIAYAPALRIIEPPEFATLAQLRAQELLRRIDLK